MGKLKRKTSLLISKKRYYKIPWFEKYCINTDSEIRLWDNPNIIIHRYEMSKYINDVVVLDRDDGITIVIELDRLMMNVFVGDMKYRIIHKDGDRKNYNIKNLKYDVPLEDMSSHIFAGKVFKQIPGFSRYYISEDAIIWNDRSKIFMRIGYDLQHYPNLHMINDERKDIHTKPHILLMNTWGPEKKDPRMVCNHKDSIEYHNVLSNLEWVYQYENIYESFVCGDQKNGLVGSKEDVEKACRYLVEGKTISKIVDLLHPEDLTEKEINRYKKWVRAISKKETWRSISDKYF